MRMSTETGCPAMSIAYLACFSQLVAQLVVNDRVAGASGKFQYKKEAQGGAGDERKDGARENSLHSCFASYNTGDIVPLNGVTLA